MRVYVGGGVGDLQPAIWNLNLKSAIILKWGSLRLRTISLATPVKPGSATVKVGDKTTASSLSWQDGKATITLSNEVVLTAGQSLKINLTK